MENLRHDRTEPPGRQIRKQAVWRNRRRPALTPPEHPCVSKCLARSPCGVQSKQPENVAAQLRQPRIAAMSGIGTINRDIGLDPRGTVTEHDDAVGEKQRLLDV